MEKQNIVCLMGPTASGKTDLAIKLAQNLSCEIISVDSGMIYRGMDIGTAKPTLAEQALAPHRLINICDPAAAYSAAQFREDAISAIEQILQKDKTPLLVGGTMLYFKVLQQGISPLPNANQEIRTDLTKQAEQNGWEFLHKKLAKIDPQAAARISVSDSQRIQRALEVYELTGKSISELCALNPPKKLPYKFLNIALIPQDRDFLRERINRRFQLMLQNDFVAEVEQLYKRGDLHVDMPAIRAVGYRQMWNYLAGKINFAEACEQVINATNQLAKRQLTWLRSWESIERFASEDERLYDKVVELINNQKISSM